MHSSLGCCFCHVIWNVHPIPLVQARNNYLHASNNFIHTILYAQNACAHACMVSTIHKRILSQNHLYEWLWVHLYFSLQRWYMNGNIECFTNGHVPLALLSLAMLLLFLVLLPVAIVYTTQCSKVSEYNISCIIIEVLIILYSSAWIPLASSKYVYYSRYCTLLSSTMRLLDIHVLASNPGLLSKKEGLVSTVCACA